MSVFTSQIRNKPWVWQVTALGFVLGAILAASLKTQDQIRQADLPFNRFPQLASAYANMKATTDMQRREIADLQKQLGKYQAAAASQDATSALLNEDLRKARLFGGMVPVTGRGVIVTLRDSKTRPPQTAEISPETYAELVKPYIIHDQDIQAVLNELRAAGAEALAVNDQRIVGTTAVRCVGPVVLVNNVQTNGSPVRIKAIGDPDTLVSSLTMAGGVQESYKITDPSMFSIDKLDSITLPAYAGPTRFVFSKPATPAKAEQAQKDSEDAAEANR